MVLSARGDETRALEMLYRASEVEPANPQAKFHRANVLMKMGRYEKTANGTLM